MSSTAAEDRDFLDRIDGAIVLLVELRSEFAAKHATPKSQVCQLGIPENRGVKPSADFIETAVAAERFGLAHDTVRRWCREGLGLKRGGRWQASVSRFRQRLDGSCG
jgi:hypothetical protein